MHHLASHIFRILGLLLVLQTSSFPNLLAQPMASDFEKMAGKRVSLSVEDPADSLSSREIIELRDENGLPRWFGRYFHKVVCLTGECRMVHIWLYWDGAGNYLGFVPDKKEPLTKTDHHDFSEADYRKLHSILADSVSVLKSLKQEDMIILPEKKEQQLKVDAITGATRQYLQDYLVRNAAYTCYTLWHTVYGPTRERILSHMEARIDAEFLGKIFSLNDPVLCVWAIHAVGKHPEYASRFSENILHLVKSGNNEVAHAALNYFTPARMSDPGIQQQMARSVGEAISQIRFEIIWKLKSLPRISNESIGILLDFYLQQKIYAGLLGYICEMIHAENLKDPAILQQVKKMSKDKNPYVRNLAAQLRTGAKK